MNNTTKIRQFLTTVRKMIECPHEPLECVDKCDFCKRTRLLDEVLSLLPCETCNGTGKVSNGIGHTCVRETPGWVCNMCEAQDPCPDCKPTTMEQEEQQPHQQSQ